MALLLTLLVLLPPLRLGWIMARSRRCFKNRNSLLYCILWGMGERVKKAKKWLVAWRT